MKDCILSFKIDHSKLVPGVYLHEIKRFENNFVTTYDFRFKTPNSGDTLTPLEAHTIEHVAATFFTENLKDKIYWGPMGCLTGFYLVLNGKHDLNDVIPLLEKLDEYWDELLKNNEVPGKNPIRCGNYKLLDISEGYKAWKDFYSNRERWGKEYPILDDDNFDLEKYQNDVDYNVKIKR